MRQEKLAKQAERLATKKPLEPASGVSEVGERDDQKGWCYWWAVSTAVELAAVVMMAAIIFGVIYYIGGF